MHGTKITLNSLRALPPSPPSKTKVILWDLEIKGFGAYRTCAGTISFVYQYAMPGGKTQSFMFGRLGELTLDQARGMAADMAFARRRGMDPISERKKQLKEAAAEEELTLSNYSIGYLERRDKQGKPLNKGQRAIVTRDIVGLLGEARMDRLTVADVEVFADKLAERGPSARRMGLVYLNTILNDAVRRDVISKNVATKVTINKAGETKAIQHGHRRAGVSLQSRT